MSLERVTHIVIKEEPAEIAVVVSCMEVRALNGFAPPDVPDATAAEDLEKASDDRETSEVGESMDWADD
jgi:hypothetical protein